MAEEPTVGVDVANKKTEVELDRKQKLRNYFAAESIRLGLVKSEYKRRIRGLENLNKVPDISGFIDTEESMEQLIAVFGGFYDEDDNSRARAPGTKVEFN